MKVKNQLASVAQEDGYDGGHHKEAITISSLHRLILAHPITSLSALESPIHEEKLDHVTSR